MRLAGRLLAAAVRVLPAGDRGRYAEEFRSELAEIARAGAGRRQLVEIARTGARRRRQLAHAVRVVLSVRQLHTDLRAP